VPTRPADLDPEAAFLGGLFALGTRPLPDTPANPQSHNIGFNLLKSHRPRRGTTADFRLGAAEKNGPSFSAAAYLGEPLAMRAAARLNLPALRRPPQKSYTGLRALALKWPPDHNAGCAFFSRARGRREQRSFLGGQGPPATGGPSTTRPPPAQPRPFPPPKKGILRGGQPKHFCPCVIWAESPL